ncbi:MAG: hypothetical protein AAF533_09880 [Acidobacteriota bacterium]
MKKREDERTPESTVPKLVIRTQLRAGVDVMTEEPDPILGTGG